MQETPLFRLNAEGGLARFRPLLDPRFFPGGIDHVCTLRVALNRLALLMLGRGTDPGDAASVRAMNEAVAGEMGERLFKWNG
jgi:hypothetical protein